ncbi:MAG: hypothetical protein NTW14_07505 [bacterium]|nr:hypothetical protein [bacterium]
MEIYLTLALALLTTWVWYQFVFTAPSRSWAKALIFPFSHFRQIIDLREFPAAFVIFYCYLHILDAVFAYLITPTPYIFLIEWGVIIFAELTLIFLYFFKLSDWKYCLLFLLTVSLYLGYACWKTIQARDYQVLNAFDFGEEVFLFLVALYVIIRIVRQDRFIAELEAFFVFLGLIIYSFLQCLSTIALAYNFFANLDFAYWATLLTFMFWTLSVPWMRHLKYKLT